MKKMRIAIVGAGFSGAVMARELVETGRYEVTVFESRDHVAGNCHTVRDPASGVMVHQYGPHIFHTNREDVWKYVNEWSAFGNYTNRVKAVTNRGVFSLPINLLTINQFFGERFSPEQARAFIASKGDSRITDPKNFEEQALKMIGSELYEAFFYGYTKKQWGVEPTELPASILQRLPLRFSYDDNYYNSKFQGIPVEGYTRIVEKILDHSAIDVKLKTPFEITRKRDFGHVFYSGPIDAYFNFELGRLQYRTLTFERFEAKGDYQGNPVINYCEEAIPYTRITEHKHFAPWESHERSICFKEYSKQTEAGDIPYYPVRLAEDKTRLADYVEMAVRERNVTFIGRLGTYRYLDMHAVIGETLDLAKICIAKPQTEWPRFSAEPLPPPATQRAA